MTQLRCLFLVVAFGFLARGAAAQDSCPDVENPGNETITPYVSKSGQACPAGSYVRTGTTYNTDFHTRLILTAVCLLSSFADAGQQTLAERVRRQQGAIEVHILREFSPVDLPELVKGCDLITRVVVLDNGRSHLSKDGRSMYSEFTVQVLDKYFSTLTLKPVEKIVVTKPGGTMTIEGYPITSRESDFPPFQANEEYILFLKFDASTGQYLLPYGAQGAFRNVGGLVDQVSKDTGIWNRERGQVPISEFIQELGRILSPR